MPVFLTHGKLPPATPSTVWTAGDQVVVSIRTKDVQNRYGQVALKAGRSTSTITDGDNNIVYLKTHSTYARGSSKFGQADSWELKRLRVTTDKTGDDGPGLDHRHIQGAKRICRLDGVLGRPVRRLPHAVPQVGLPRGRHRKGRSHLHAPAQNGRYRRRHPAVPVRPRGHLHMGAHVQGISTKTPGPGKPLRHLRRHAGPAKARHGEGRRSRI